MPVKTTTVGPGTLTIGDPEDLVHFESQCTNARLVPNVTKGDPIPVLSGEKAPGDRSESFQLAGTLLQDLGAVESTTLWLFRNRGLEKPFEYVPNSSADVTIKGVLTVEAIEMGGDAQTKPTSDFEFDVVGDAPQIVGNGGVVGRVASIESFEE